MKDALDGPSHRGHPTTSATVTITPKEFGIFKSFLKVIRSDFNDLSMVNGVFRAKSNLKTCIVETGFRFFNDISFNMFNIKSILKTLMTFDNNQKTTFIVDDKWVKIKDNQLNYNFAQKKNEIFDNPYIPDQEFEDSVLKPIDPDRLIVSNVVSKIDIRRLKVGIRSFAQDKISIKREANSVNACVLYMDDKLYKKKIEKDPSQISIKMPHPFKLTINQNQCFKFPVLPFKMATDHLYFSSYFDNNGSITTIFNTKLSSLFANFYTRS